HAAATPTLYPLSLHDALPILVGVEQTLHIADQPVQAAEDPATRQVERGGVGHRLRHVPVHVRPHEARHLPDLVPEVAAIFDPALDRKSTRLNSSHVKISYAVF